MNSSDIGDFHRPADPFHIGYFIRYGDIIGDRIGKYETLLHDRSALLTPAIRAESGEPATAQQHVTLDRSVKAEHHFKQCRLAAAAFAYDGRNLVMAESSGRFRPALCPSAALRIEKLRFGTRWPRFRGCRGSDPRLRVPHPVFPEFRSGVRARFSHPAWPARN